MNNFKIFIEKLSAERISKYLLLNGWKQQGLIYNNKVLQFVTSDEKESLLLPVDKSFMDYNFAMYRAISIMAEYEKVSIKSLFNKLINPSSDILKWRVSDEDTMNGAIPFISMEHNIEFIKDMLSSTCLDILSPSQYHTKLYTKEVQSQITKYKFGQTEIGSYILNILCPLGYYQYKLFDPTVGELPLSRKINLHLIRNINTLQRSAQEKSQESRDCISEGKISVNFLNSLTSLYDENKNAELSIEADWNLSIPVAEEFSSYVILDPKFSEEIALIAEEFTPKTEQNVVKSFYGKIVNIGAEAEIDNRVMVDIKVATIGENLKTITINASLNYSQYFSIVDTAFQTGSDVKVTGITSSTAKSVKIKDATIELLT
ncbi:hypothetical protein [Prevotella disiens]|uniref:hypothetical protein n=1 Tax=Prevotella disiens TaxID=28130 RepID=UPI00288A4F8F|nr:hypothetical protein [Prevotella disiens]